MGVKSTVNITRKAAEDRIRAIIVVITQSDYLELDKLSFEPHYNIESFINTTVPVDITNISKWTNKMLEDWMDRPFFRFSMFDNYLVSGAGGW